jgi:IclR family acetate operon transcriptional repressor
MHGTVATGERYRVKSLGRALDLLEHVAAGGAEGVRLADLARGIDGSKAAAYAVLQTLLAHGYVRDVGQGPSRRYRLGLSLARLGDLAVRNVGFVELALPVLRRLTDEHGLTSRAAIPDDGYAVVIARVDAPGSVRFDAALGRRELPHCTAVGKALLSVLPAERARAILRRLGLPRRTPKTLATMTALLGDLRRTAARGYAIDDEEDTEGVACVGACVRDRAGIAIGAISVTGLKPRDWKERQKVLGAAVMAAAADITLGLGGGPDGGAPA